MFRSASRTLLRRSTTATPVQQFRPPPQGRRFVNTSASSGKSRSWRSSAVRWGLAAGAVYYYCTSPAFADVRSFSLQPTSAQEHDDSSLPTIESVAAAKKRRGELAAARQAESDSDAPPQSTIAQSASEADPPAQRLPVAAASETAAETTATAQSQTPTPDSSSSASPGSPAELEEEADQQGAFNPETGEINWDCPCLGGMAHGPCGEEFRAAFSCFVYSTEEPKGMDCIDKFKGMQDCFRAHPDVYGSELEESEVDDELAGDMSGEAAPGAEVEGAGVATAVDAATPQSSSSSSSVSSSDNDSETKQTQRDVEKDIDPDSTVRAPREWHNTTEKNPATEEKEGQGEKKQKQS